MNLDALAIFENMYDGVYIVDKDRKILYWNKGSEKITGYKAKEVVNSHCYHDILHHVTVDGFNLCQNGCPLTQTLQTGEILENDVFLHHKLGHRVPVTVKTMPVYDKNKNIVACVEVFTDTRYKKSKYEENLELKKLVELDPLTKLYNRRYIDFLISSAIKEYNEFKIDFGLLFIDIDDFKKVNDTFGHLAGDEVLKTLAKTLQENIKPHDFAGRWGGEEFVIIMKNPTLETLKKQAEKIRVLCQNSVMKQRNNDISVTVSIGGAIFEETDTSETLVDRADHLMYKSKSLGKNKVTI